jgi:hypothetical protein
MADEKEGFTWKKWAAGIFNPLNTAKMSAQWIQAALIIGFIILGLKAFGMVKNWVFGQAASRPAIGTVTGGEVTVRGDDKKKIGILNF